MLLDITTRHEQDESSTPTDSLYSSTLRRIHLRRIDTETAGPLEWHASCFFLIFPSDNHILSSQKYSVHGHFNFPCHSLSTDNKTPEFFLPGWKATLASREKLSPLPKVQENLLFRGKELTTPAEYQGGLFIPGCKPLLALNSNMLPTSYQQICRVRLASVLLALLPHMVGRSWVVIILHSCISSALWPMAISSSPNPKLKSKV